MTGQVAAAPAITPAVTETQSSAQEATGLSTTDSMTNATTNSTTNSTTEPTPFASCWNEMFENIFSKDPLIFHTLKNETPDYQNNIIKITVINEIQKQKIEERKTAILEYWHNHFSLNVEDITIDINEHKETKEVIINSEDRMRHMMKQNKDLAEFLNILSLNIID